MLALREARIAQRTPHTGLVVVSRGTVDVPIAGFQRALNYGSNASSSMRSTPKPICGIRLPSESVTIGVWKVAMETTP